MPPGGTITYTLTYGNHGSRGATGVVITETVPAGTNFVSAGSTPGWVCTPDGNAGSTCTLAVGAIAAGAADATATFVVHVLDPLPGNVTSISDTASIADDGANGADPTPNNNSSTATTTVAQGQVQVPTLSAVGLALLALLLAASGAWLLRRRRAAARR